MSQCSAVVAPTLRVSDLLVCLNVCDCVIVFVSVVIVCICMCCYQEQLLLSKGSHVSAMKNRRESKNYTL